jgi:ribonuclease HIII
MFSRSVKFHFDPVFLKKKRNFNFCKTCVYVSIVQNISRLKARAAMELVLVKQFAVSNHYASSYVATSSSMFILNSLHLTI